MMEKSNRKRFLNLTVKTCLIVFFTAVSAIANAQTRGTVTVTQDPRIDTLLARRLALSKVGNSAQANTAIGYRVQFFMGADRGEAYAAQAKFNDLFPDIKTYIVYFEPNFKVKAGDFKTKLEATRLMEQLTKQFTTLFIIPEKINLPKLAGDDQK